MTDSHTKVNLHALQDMAAGAGVGDTQEARFPQKELGAEATGLSHHRVKPGKRQAFAHRHAGAEEVYVVLSGSGRVKLDEEIVELAPFDAIRVAPAVTRQFEGGPDGIEFLAFGPRVAGDGEIVQDWWTG
jgi:mannose-6-phosphate isomerase-like protein (cupin superfamily)